MRSLHWIIVGVLMLALLGIPSWYTLTGQGAQAIPGAKAQTLRANNNRSVVGGGTRLGK